jgi:hypothetical protein
VKLLSAAEEIILAKRIERGDLQAKQRIIESNLRLVHAIARAYRGSSVPFADLVREGTIGLVRAVERLTLGGGEVLNLRRVVDPTVDAAPAAQTSPRGHRSPLRPR